VPPSPVSPPEHPYRPSTLSPAVLRYVITLHSMCDVADDIGAYGPQHRRCRHERQNSPSYRTIYLSNGSFSTVGQPHRRRHSQHILSSPCRGGQGEGRPMLPVDHSSRKERGAWDDPAVSFITGYSSRREALQKPQASRALISNIRSGNGGERPQETALAAGGSHVGRGRPSPVLHTYGISIYE